GKWLDERRFAMCEYQDQYNIPKTGHLSGPIAKATKNFKTQKNPPTNKRTSNSNETTANNEELNDLDAKIAK
ncbi:14788_t:CDS:2, partial [Dentiscutata erythropus]